MGITCSCLQVVLWWVGCVRSMPIDAALRLVLPPLSFALLCALLGAGVLRAGAYQR
jgi:hypothetical protein